MKFCAHFHNNLNYIGVDSFFLKNVFFFQNFLYAAAVRYN